MSVSARLGALYFEGGTGDATYTLDDEGLEGWFDAPGVRGDRVEIPAQHGEFDLPTFLEARIVTLRGQIHARNDFDYEMARAALMGVASQMSLQPLTVESPVGAQTAMVKPADAPYVKNLLYGRVGEYRLTLRAPNPRRLGASRVSGAGEPALNYGNFHASPKVRVTRMSGSGGYTVTAGAGRAVVSRDLAVGSSHVIDVATGALTTVSGARLSGLDTLIPWTVPPGSALVHSVSSGVSLQVTTADTYV